MSKDRILWLDTLKVMAIYLVVLGHIVSTTYQPNLKGIIYSFHMPLFFMISGYLNKDKRNAIKANVFALIVPYVLLCVLYFPFYALALAHTPLKAQTCQNDIRMTGVPSFFPLFLYLSHNR